MAKEKIKIIRAIAHIAAAATATADDDDVLSSELFVEFIIVVLELLIGWESCMNGALLP